MATQRLSPTARLLRGSRLFSIPPPLPKPSSDHGSDTATLPYPTHAAIETTQSSLSRGDWGLKRPLPQKSTRGTSTPTIRIEAIDSINHITDFNSAADHVLTLRKWQEMGLPISMPQTRTVTSSSQTLLTPTKSVFEQHLDSTDTNGGRGSDDMTRWKFRGPWLAGKTEGEFTDYLKKEIKRRRPEFRRFLRKCLQEKTVADLRRTAIDRGESGQVQESVMTEQQFKLTLRELRQPERREELQEYIKRFLDLPGLDEKASEPRNSPLGYSTRGIGTTESDQGPPKTHRSAGLSYLRKTSHVPNHPILGPINTQPPIQGRILVSASQGPQQQKIMIGVGGVIAEGLPATNVVVDKRDPIPGWTRYDPDIEGGAKIWVHPQRANIDSSGRINLRLQLASKQTLAVWEGEEEKPLSEVVKANDRDVPDLAPSQSQPREFPYAGQPDGSDKDALLGLIGRSVGNKL